MLIVQAPNKTTFILYIDSEFEYVPYDIKVQDRLEK